jgi:hypothetical protein
MIEGMATGTAAVYLPRMPESSRLYLRGLLGRLPAFTSLHEVILYSESAIDWAAELFTSASSSQQLWQCVESVAPSFESAERIKHRAGDAHGLFRLIADSREIVRRFSEVILLSPTDYTRIYEHELESRLESNPLAATLGIWYEAARNEECTASCRLAFVRSAIELLNGGLGVLKDCADPFESGNFECRPFTGGFELLSDLYYGDLRVKMDIGLRAK